MPVTRPGIEIVAAAAEALPFADSSFDVTLSQLVVNFLDDARAGVRGMARVTRQGGIVARSMRLGTTPVRCRCCGRSGTPRA